MKPRPPFEPMSHASVIGDGVITGYDPGGNGAGDLLVRNSAPVELVTSTLKTAEEVRPVAALSLPGRAE